MGYKFYNANPLQNSVSDCVLRAVSLAEGESWDFTYEKLSKLAQRQGEMIDSVDFVEDYLDKRYPRQSHYAKTVGEFSEEFKRGIYLVTMPRTYNLHYKSDISMIVLTHQLEECGAHGKLHKNKVQILHFINATLAKWESTSLQSSHDCVQFAEVAPNCKELI